MGVVPNKAHPGAFSMRRWTQVGLRPLTRYKSGDNLKGPLCSKALASGESPPRSDAGVILQCRLQREQPRGVDDFATTRGFPFVGRSGLEPLTSRV
jgi:hypothetical protein